MSDKSKYIPSWAMYHTSVFCKETYYFPLKCLAQISAIVVFTMIRIRSTTNVSLE